MSRVLTVISKNNIKDIHGLILKVKEQIPGMVYQFGEDESKYKFGFQPDVFAYELYKSTRYLDWSSELKRELTNGLITKSLWHYNVRIPVLSNCSLWNIGLMLVKEIMLSTDGLFYPEEIDEETDKGLTMDAFINWQNKFNCEKEFESELETTITLVEQLGDEVAIFGPQAPYTFNINIVKELRAKKKIVAAFEKRMLKLQNACLDEAYTKASKVVIKVNNDIEYKASVCNNFPYLLVINDQIDYILFTSIENKEEFYIVPAKKAREVMPIECFFDEYSFFVDLFCDAIWHSEILPKAKLLHTEF